MSNHNYTPKAELGWVDFSPSHKNTFDEILRALQKPGVVDELGVGSVRDTFSDRMFPGVSTIMTRAKYYLLVPYILRDYLFKEIKKKPNPSEYLRKTENRTIERLYNQLREAEKNSELSEPERALLTEGILGSTTQRQKKELQRKPSEIYWNGIRTWGLIQTEYSLGNLLSEIEKSRMHVLKALDNEDGQESLNSHPYINLINVNELGKNWDSENKLSILLDRQEAELLRDNVLDIHKNSLLFHLLHPSNDTLREVLWVSKSFSEFVSKLPRNVLHTEIEMVVKQADLFWKIMDGAHIIYNFLLFKTYRTDMVNPFIETWNEWLNGIRGTHDDIVKLLNIDQVWELVYNTNHRVDEHTKSFITKWINKVKSLEGMHVENKSLHKLIKEQERQKKGGRSRLLSYKNSDFAQKYKGNRIGFVELDYRYSTVKMIVRDIYNGLQKQDS